MKAQGRVFLSRTKPSLTRTPAGEAQLRLCVVDRLNHLHSEAWRLEWRGPEAEAFMSAHGAQLVPGSPLYVELDKLRCYPIGATCELLAAITRITLETTQPA